jgi:4-hydroxy-tetrahydrodipicolinate reductase
MRFNVIGPGKTGQYVQEHLKQEEIAHVFSSKNPPTLELLREADASIIFVDGTTMTDLIPLLLEAGKPVVTGSTAVQWPTDLDHLLRQQNVGWIRAANFSPMMNFFFYVTRKLAGARELLGSPEASVYEVHHVTKKDKPSGTALRLAQGLNWPNVEITVDRKEDYAGIHRLTLENAREKLTVEHESRSRAMYAQGAVGAARLLMGEPHWVGLIDYEELMYEKFDHITP